MKLLRNLRSLRCSFSGLALVIAATSSAFAGVRDGGGGEAFVCRLPNQQIRAAYLVDLIEGENLQVVRPWGPERLHIVRNDTQSVETQMTNLIARIRQVDVGFSELFTRALNETYVDYNLLNAGIHLEPVRDSHVIIGVDGCPREQLANYRDDGTGLNIVTDIYYHFSETDAAAFYTHETLYKIYRRNFGDTTSDRARILVAVLFSTTVLTPSDLWGASYLPGRILSTDPDYQLTEPIVSDATAASLETHYRLARIFGVLPETAVLEAVGTWQMIAATSRTEGSSVPYQYASVGNHDQPVPFEVPSLNSWDWMISHGLPPQALKIQEQSFNMMEGLRMVDHGGFDLLFGSTSLIQGEIHLREQGKSGWMSNSDPNPFYPGQTVPLGPDPRVTYRATSAAGALQRCKIFSMTGRHLLCRYTVAQPAPYSLVEAYYIYRKF